MHTLAYRHRQEEPSRLPFPSPSSAFKRIDPFSYLLQCPPKCSTRPAHRGAARRPQTHCSKSKEMGCRACSPSHAARPFLSVQPTLQQVTEHQAGIFNSTMLKCDNMIPTSFLLWVKLGEERGEEAVTTSIFHQSNPSLTSYQSGCLSSQCPCSFFSSSVTKQSQVVYLQRFLH